MSSLEDCIKQKYISEQVDNYGYIMYLSSSPECKKGLLPNILTLNDYNIDSAGNLNDLDLKHVNELDLTDNLLCDWNEVQKIIDSFPNLSFLNLSNNLLNQQCCELDIKENYSIRKIVFNGNKIAWSIIIEITQKLPVLEELHVSTNSLHDIENCILKHNNLVQIFLSCNNIRKFETVFRNIIMTCPRLNFLNLSECPVTSLCEIEDGSCSIKALNLTSTHIQSWSEIEKLNKFQNLTELRIQNIPFLQQYSSFERRMMLISRLPKIRVLNGGDQISLNEREDAERSFIRYYLDKDESLQPARFFQLVEIHGLLEPLVEIDLTPETFATVQIFHNDIMVEKKISLRQSVKSFKRYLKQVFKDLPKSIRVYYYDKELSKLTGPEELKWNNKDLYTYNVHDGDTFVIDKKDQFK